MTGAVIALLAFVLGGVVACCSMLQQQRHQERMSRLYREHAETMRRLKP